MHASSSRFPNTESSLKQGFVCWNATTKSCMGKGHETGRVRMHLLTRCCLPASRCSMSSRFRRSRPGSSSFFFALSDLVFGFGLDGCDAREQDHSYTHMTRISSFAVTELLTNSASETPAYALQLASFPYLPNALCNLQPLLVLRMLTTAQ